MTKYLYSYAINCHSDGVFSFSLKQCGSYLKLDGERIEWFNTIEACEHAASQKCKELNECL